MQPLIGARIDRYCRSVPTISTSNLDFSEWGDAFPDNRILGSATLDRLRHGAYRIVIDDKSFRKPKPMPKTAKTRLQNRAKNACSRPIEIEFPGHSKSPHYADHLPLDCADPCRRQGGCCHVPRPPPSARLWLATHER